MSLTRAMEFSDRRSVQRYPVEADLEYKLLRNGEVLQLGRGVTVNLSSGGLLFASDRAVRPGIEIELSIDWPARMDGVTKLRLWASGKTVRAGENCTAVRIHRYEFRTAGKTCAADAFYVS